MKVKGIVVAAVTALTALAAGCASSGAAPASGSGSAAADAITIGTIGSYTGAQASSIGAAKDAIEGWASYVNTHGGIDGHPVDLIVKDDAGNPALALAAAKTLVESDHVVAIVSDQSTVDSAWSQYVSTKGIPVIGGISLAPPNGTNPDFFPTGPNFVAMIYNVLVLARGIGPKVAYLYCAESPHCAQAVPLFQNLASSAGVHLVLSEKVSASAADYTAVCLALKNSGAQSYEVGAGSAEVVRVAAACALQGVTAKQVTSDGTMTDSWLSVPALNGARGAELAFPFFDNSTPATKQFRDVMAKYAHLQPGDLDGNAAYAWTAGKLFEAAVENSGARGTVTPSSIKNGLYVLRGETLGGLTVPLTFSPGKPNVIDCGFTAGIDTGKFVAPHGLTPSCAPTATVSRILSALH
jgi:branched-chain amino acid transport system substrate-binding protein